MEIIIPANRIEGDINSQVVIDNEITKVVVKNYNITKQTSEDANDIVHTVDYADNVFEERKYYIYDKIFSDDFRRIETFYTEGSIEITVTQNMEKIDKVYSKVSGKYIEGVFKWDGGAEEETSALYNHSYWKNPNPDTYLFNNFIRVDKKEDFSDIKLSAPSFKGTTLPNRSKINIKSISVSGNSYIIDIDFKVLTKTKRYIYRSIWGFGENSYKEYSGESFSIVFDASSVKVETKDNLSLTYGEGSKTLSYNTNELFQLTNTYNDGEKEVPIGEFVGKQVVGMYKNGRKTATMTAITDNLIVSNNKLSEGHYGVRGRLERQIYKVGDNVIPYKIDKNLKELPNSEYLGVPQSFKVAENEVKYDGKLTQTLKTQENTYFNVYYDEDLFNVYRYGLAIGSGDRIFREEELSVELQMPYDKNNIFILGYNDTLTSYQQDSEDTTKYKPISVNVNGFMNLYLYQKIFSLLSAPNSYADTSSLAGFGEGNYRGLVYNAISGFDKNETHKILVEVETKNTNGQTYTEEIEVVLNDDKSTIVNVGRNKSVEIAFYKMEYDYICSLYFTNSSTEKLTYITLRAIYQSATTQIA